MKYYQSFFLLLMTLLLLSGRVRKNRTTDSIGEHEYRNGPGTSHSILPVAGSLFAADTSVYEVRFSFNGYMTFHGDASVCPIRPNGTVVLKGLLKGIENIHGNDDIIYVGTLQLDIDIDICSAKGEGDDAKLCSITVTGSGKVKTELTIYYDGRGGYIQIKDTTSQGFSKNAGGTCDPAEIAEERQMIPLKTIATVFNGLELPMLTSRTLRVGPSQFVRSPEGELLVEVLRKIR